MSRNGRGRRVFPVHFPRYRENVFRFFLLSNRLASITFRIFQIKRLSVAPKSSTHRPRTSLATARPFTKRPLVQFSLRPIYTGRSFSKFPPEVGRYSSSSSETRGNYGTEYGRKRYGSLSSLQFIHKPSPRRKSSRDVNTDTSIFGFHDVLRSLIHNRVA